MNTSISTLDELKALARTFLEQYPRGAVVGLSGELGAGKTAFVRACIEVLAERAALKLPRVASPSYVLHQTYPKLKPPVDHYDLYRLDTVDANALSEMGYFEIVASARENLGFVFIEWPERAEGDVLGVEVSVRLQVLDRGRCVVW